MARGQNQAERPPRRLPRFRVVNEQLVLARMRTPADKDILVRPKPQPLAVPRDHVRRNLGHGGVVLRRSRHSDSVAGDSEPLEPPGAPAVDARVADVRDVQAAGQWTLIWHRFRRLLAVHLQQGLGHTAFETGLALLPFALGAFCASAASAMRKGQANHILLAAGSLVMSVTLSSEGTYEPFLLVSAVGTLLGALLFALTGIFRSSRPALAGGGSSQA